MENKINCGICGKEYIKKYTCELCEENLCKECYEKMVDKHGIYLSINKIPQCDKCMDNLEQLSPSNGTQMMDYFASNCSDCNKEKRCKWIHQFYCTEKTPEVWKYVKCLAKVKIGTKKKNVKVKASKGQTSLF